MSKHFHILGAGLCGSLLAILLARRGIDITLIERQPDPRQHAASGGRSINLALAARGIRALRLAGAFDDVEPLLLPMRGRMIHHENGDTELQPYGQRPQEVIYSVSRAELNGRLIERAEREHGVAIRFGQAATGYDDGTLEFDGGRTLAAAPLIAADGAGSIVRRALEGEFGATEELLPHSYKELTLPAAADGSHQLTPDALHIWPRGGFMLIALPNPGGDFTLTLFLPNEGDTSFATAIDPVEFFTRYFADLLPLLPNLEEEFTVNPVGILGTVRCQHWHQSGELLLIGDAAHAIVPFHGQGMNLAFEDCAVLDGILDKTHDMTTAFATFETAQRANANAIANMALENYIEMRDRVREPAFLLQKQLAFELERALPDTFIPRYSMVMFHDDIPYAEAERRGTLQQAFLQRETAGVSSLDDLDLPEVVNRARGLY